MAYKYIWRIDFIDPTKKEPFIQNWNDASKILQKYPGARGTRLHEVIDEPNAMVAIAEWDSQEARQNMLDDVAIGESDLAKVWQKYQKNDEFGKVTTLARLNEVDLVRPDK